MLIEHRVIESPYSVEDCQKKLVHASYDWQLTDFAPTSFQATLYPKDGHFYLVASRFVRRGLFGRRCWTFCRVELAQNGNGTSVSAKFLNRGPLVTFFVALGLSLLATLAAFRVRGQAQTAAIVISICSLWGSVYLFRTQRTEDKQSVIDLLEAILTKR